MWNRCDYFESEYFREPEDCLAFSVDGSILAENEAKLFEQTGGFFGKPLEQEKTLDDINRKIIEMAIEMAKKSGKNWFDGVELEEWEKENANK